MEAWITSRGCLGMRRRLYVFAGTVCVLLLAGVIVRGQQPSALERQRDAARTKWAGIHLVANERYGLRDNPKEVRYEYWRDVRGRWRLETLASSNPFEAGNLKIFDGTTEHFYDARLKQWRSLTGMQPSHNASYLISPDRAVFTLYRAKIGEAVSSGRANSNSNQVIERVHKIRGNNSVGGTGGVAEVMLKEIFSIDTEHMLITRYERFVDGEVDGSFEIISFDYNTPMVDTLFAPPRP